MNAAPEIAFSSEQGKANYVAARRQYPAQAIVDLKTMRDNMAHLVSVVGGPASGTAVMGVVKADAYGHGLLPAALAALAGVDTSLYEAAKIDGAGRLQLIRYVDLPAIMPTCAILLIMNMGSVLNVGFDKIYLMQNSLNMPATEVIATYTYKIGIINGQYSYSTAIGLFNTLVNFVFLITANAIAKRVSDTSIF